VFVRSLGRLYETFRDWKSENGNDLKLVVKAALGVASALEYMHAHGLVHANMSPHNVHLSRDWEVKLNDYGLVDLTTTQVGMSVLGLGG
jgi:serine/threonine protein kinase